MESSFSTLSLLAEILTAFVTFAAIVGTLRVGFGTALPEFQKLLIQFFVVSGMIGVSIVVMPLILAEFLNDERAITQYSILYAFTCSGLYLAGYLRQRFRIHAPTPVVSAIVIIGYFIWLPILALIAGGLIFEPTLGVIAAFGFWGLLSSLAVFVYFLNDFVNPEKPQP
jgi:hypothetical protein